MRGARGAQVGGRALALGGMGVWALGGMGVWALGGTGAGRHGRWALGRWVRGTARVCSGGTGRAGHGAATPPTGRPGRACARWLGQIRALCT